MSNNPINNPDPVNHMLSPLDLKRFQKELFELELELTDGKTIEFALKFAAGELYHPRLETAYQRAFPHVTIYKLCPDPTEFALSSLSADFSTNDPFSQNANLTENPHLDTAQISSICSNSKNNEPDPLIPIKAENIQIIQSKNLRKYSIQIDRSENQSIDVDISDDTIRLDFQNSPYSKEQINILCFTNDTQQKSTVTWSTSKKCSFQHDFFPPSLADIKIVNPGQNNHVMDILVYPPKNYTKIMQLLEKTHPDDSTIASWWYSPQPELNFRNPIYLLQTRREKELLALLDNKVKELQ